jgi:hypothetical protein
MSEQLKAATDLDIVQAVRERATGKPVPPAGGNAGGGRRTAAHQ